MHKYTAIRVHLDTYEVYALGPYDSEEEAYEDLLDEIREDFYYLDAIGDEGDRSPRELVEAYNEWQGEQINTVEKMFYG